MRGASSVSGLSGLGYGLSMARNYARSLGGDLKVLSNEGHGTTAFLYLPIIDEDL